MYLVELLYEKYGKLLNLELVAGSRGLQRRIKVPEVYCPSLGLAGYLKGHAPKRMLVFGKIEIQFLSELTREIRIKRLQDLFDPNETPAVIVTQRCKPPKEMIDLCEEMQMPLFRSLMTTMNLITKLTLSLTEEFAQTMSYHGTLVEVFGVGVLIQGDSSVGKSEAALGLIERGHRLVSDDIVKVKKRDGDYLEGFGADLTKHLIEIRGIGIINVAYLYGAICVRESKSLDVVVKLETWLDQQYYDRMGMEEKYCDILGIKLPFHVLPVKPGRDVVLFLETIALMHRLKTMGYHAAKEFSSQVLEATTQ